MPERVPVSPTPKTPTSRRTKPLGEPDVRSVEVQHSKVAVADIAEAVGDADRSRDIGAWSHAHDLVADEELGLTREHVERVDVVGVAVQVDAFEVRPEAKLDGLELRQFGEDAVMAMGAGNLLALPVPEQDPPHAYMPIAWYPAST